MLGEGISILDGLVEHFSTRKQWKALGDNFIHRRHLLYWDSPQDPSTSGQSLFWVFTPFGLHPRHVQDHWVLSFLLLKGVLEKTTFPSRNHKQIPSRNHKQIPLFLSGGGLCFWAMLMESRTGKERTERQLEERQTKLKNSLLVIFLWILVNNVQDLNLASRTSRQSRNKHIYPSKKRNWQETATFQTMPCFSASFYKFFQVSNILLLERSSFFRDNFPKELCSFV